jgi:subtilisin family serine protease
MVAISSRLCRAALLLVGADGARRKRASGAAAPQTKLIAGVPVLNYHTAYGGKGSFAELDREQEQEWVVVVKPGTTDAQVQAMCKGNKKGCNLVGHPQGGVPFLEMRGTEQDVEAVVNTGAGAVKYVEPDTQVFATPEVEAESQAATWGLTRIGADERGRTGAGTNIFVLDTGVRVTHEEFNGRVIPTIDTSSLTLVECNGDLSCAPDVRGHGTHTAGTAAGQTYGVAPSATIRSAKVLDDQGGGQWSMSYTALDWLAINAVRPAVASMSLGGRGTQQAIVDAIDGVVNAGVTVVVAAGNENIDACEFAPAFVPSAITVGSTDSRDARSWFSNYGSCTNIWAPGSEILSAGHVHDSQSVMMDGTSMACPHVSGAAALVLEADPTKKSSAVLQELLGNAATDAITGLQTGDTNALLYVGQRAPTPAPPPTPPTPAVPTPAPTPPPTSCPSEFSTGPDWDGDCSCNAGLRCYENGTEGCTGAYGKTPYFFSIGCSGCVCQ